MEQTEQEKKLLEILGTPEVESAAGEEKQEAISSAFPYLDEKAKKLMAKLMTVELPSPEEIEQAEKIAQHNAEVARKRQLRLKAREERRKRKRK